MLRLAKHGAGFFSSLQLGNRCRFGVIARRCVGAGLGLLRSSGLWLMDALTGIAKFLALNGATTLTALGLASRCGLRSRAERLLAIVVLFVGVALASAMALGLLGQLRFWPLLGVQALIAALAASVARWPIIIETIDLRALPRLIAGAPLRVAAAFVGVAYLHVTFLGVVSEPFAGDELMYHLPLVASFAQEGRIFVPQLGRYWHTDWWVYHPASAYLLYQWWVLPFGGGVLVDLVQLPYALATALATFVLARKFGATQRAALWSALLFLAVPIVINQCKTALVDVTLSFLFTAGLTFALSTPLSGGPLLLAALAWGAVPGAKLSGLIYLAAGAACTVLQLASGTNWRLLLRRAAVAGAAMGAAVLVLSGYWFLRNYWLKGSAIFPLSVLDAQDMAWSNVIFYGPLMPLLDFTVYQPLFFYNYETGVGAQFAGLALPAAAALTSAALRRRHFGVAAAALLPWLMYPFWVVSHSREPHTLFRFVLPAMPMGFAAVGWLISHTPRQRLVEALAALSIAFSTVNAVPHVGTFLVPESMQSGVARLMIGAPRFGRFDRMGDLAIQDYRRAWYYLDRLPGAHHIAASHLIFAYPMLGSDFRHRLFFFDAAARQQWLADLRAAQITQVALGQTLDPEARLSAENGQLRLRMHVRVTGDEYLGAMHAVPPQAIRGVRIRYEVPSPANARAVLGLNRFTDTFELPLDMPRTQREYTAEWSGQLTDLELQLGFVPRTRLRDDIELRVAAIDLLAESGEAVPLPLAAERWSRASWPLEYYWMENDPQHFRLAFKDRDYWAGPAASEMRVYEVLGGGAQ